MKQVILIRDDLDISRGKAVAQGSHASVNAMERANDSVTEEWLENGGVKIVLKVDSESKLRKIIGKADKLPTSIVNDFGRTEVEENTTTAGAIGPAEEEEIDEITGNLPLYR